MGMRDGDWTQFGLGADSLALDVFTLGSASVTKGAVMATMKISAKTLAKTAAREGAVTRSYYSL
ncbi:MAG: hypothetical protein EOO92_19600 [Pedobacter sp.]|nr:MAG: hypothetical protein EOO92_19600 [Pedobacter sp.]